MPKYYEGWAVTLSGISIPIEHAWLVTKEGRVIDTTFAITRARIWPRQIRSSLHGS